MKRLILVLFTLLSLTKNSYGAGEIHIGVTDNQPWAYKHEGKLSGIYPELLRSLNALNTSDAHYKVKILPLKRILKEMQSENSPLAFAIMSHKPKRAEVMEPLIPIYTTPFVLVSRIDQPLNSIEDIKNKQVAMLVGGSGCPCLNSSLDYHRVRLNHHKQGLKMLMLNRVDAVAGPSTRLFELADTLGIESSLAEPVPYEWRTVWLWASKQNKPSIEQSEHLVSSMKELLKKGVLENLTQRHLKPSQLRHVVLKSADE